MERKKFCIILKNGVEINAVADRMEIKRTLIRKKVKHIEINDPQGFIHYLDVREIAAVLAYPAPEEGKGNG